MPCTSCRAIWERPAHQVQVPSIEGSRCMTARRLSAVGHVDLRPIRVDIHVGIFGKGKGRVLRHGPSSRWTIHPTLKTEPPEWDVRDIVHIRNDLREGRGCRIRVGMEHYGFTRGNRRPPTLVTVVPRITDKSNQSPPDAASDRARRSVYFPDVHANGRRTPTNSPSCVPTSINPSGGFACHLGRGYSIVRR